MFISTGKRRKMEGFRHQGRPVYIRPTPETYAYQNLYGTVRTNPNGRARPALDLDTTAKNKKSFNFLPWRKNKNRTEDPPMPLAKHNKYKFGSVSALSSGGLYRDFGDTSSLSYTPSYSSSDLKHASVKSVGGKVRGLVTYPWETYSGNNNNNKSEADVRNSVNNHRNNVDVGAIVEKTRDLSLSDAPRPLCKCQKKKSGPFGTLNLNSLKASKCNCGFSSVRSTRGFAPPPPPPRRKSILPEKVDLYAVHEDQVQVDPQFGGYRRKHENIYDTLSRHGKYRSAPSPPSQPHSSKFIQSIEKCKKDPYSSVASRKSILECDVTAYDLVKSYLKADSQTVDSDIDDDLSDNIIEGKNNDLSSSKELRKEDGLDKSYKPAPNKSPSPVSSESESGIYSQASSVRIGGHGMKVFHPLDGNNSPQLYSEGSKTNSVDSRTSSWSNSSLSDDGIYSLPEPDYDDVVQDTDSVLTFSDGVSSSSSLRKYASGGYLDSPISSRNSDNSRVGGQYETPRFSTIRKATSMMSLVGSEGGTLRGRPKVPSVPEIPSSSAAAAPPPPPPPPPPPNFSMSSFKIDSETLTKSKQSLNSDVPPPSKKQVPSGNNVAGSIANELSEKLKSNRPILKKKEIVPKQPMSVNSHNPYAEVKSILKKTDKSVNSSSSTESSPNNKEVLDLLVKKKRVQFKSLSNESLLSNQKNRTLSSSSDDEEWEEARDSFANCNSDSKISSNDSKISFSDSKVGFNDSKTSSTDSKISFNDSKIFNNDSKISCKDSKISFKNSTTSFSDSKSESDSKTNDGFQDVRGFLKSAKEESCEGETGLIKNKSDSKVSAA